MLEFHISRRECLDLLLSPSLKLSSSSWQKETHILWAILVCLLNPTKKREKSWTGTIFYLHLHLFKKTCVLFRSIISRTIPRKHQCQQHIEREEHMACLSLSELASREEYDLPLGKQTSLAVDTPLIYESII